MTDYEFYYDVNMTPEDWAREAYEMDPNFIPEEDSSNEFLEESED